MTREEIPAVSASDPADAHAGASSAEVLDAMRGAFAAVHAAAADLALRPTSIEVHVHLGLIQCAVRFPGCDTASVDALADRYDLPAALPGLLYTRTGLADLGEVDGSLTVRTVRPGVDMLAPAPAAAAPRVITGELPAPTAPAPAPVRRELIPADPS